MNPRHYVDLKDTSRELQPTYYFMVNCLLYSRMETGLVSNQDFYDEDVNVYLAHLLSLRYFASAKLALRSQIPLLALMILYTVSSLWILSQPIVEDERAAESPARIYLASPSQLFLQVQPVPDVQEVTGEQRALTGDLLVALPLVKPERGQVGAADVEADGRLAGFTGEVLGGC